ncbi:MAG: hypothetical protein M3O46_19915 [Myxococcota bacterium]|nr:hypothetical protein [Myxococcota bacterium]
MTVFGSHTVHELSDQVTLQDAREAALARAGDLAAGAWEAADSRGHAQWVADFAAWLHAYQAPRAAAHAAVLGTPANLWDLVPAEDVYVAFVAAFHPWSDLNRRMIAAPASVAAFAPTKADDPPPGNAPDADLGVFKRADVATHAIDAAGASVASAVASVVPSTTKLAIVGALGLGALLLVARIVK